MTWKSAIVDLMGLAGIASIAVGTWWMHPPVSLVVTGVILLGIAVAAGARGDG